MPSPAVHAQSTSHQRQSAEWSPSECAETTAAMKDARSAALTRSRALPSLECPTELAALVTDFWAGCWRNCPFDCEMALEAP